MKATKSRFDTRKLVLLALLTAIVAVLQALAAVLPVYPFTLTLVLIPMVIGAALVSAPAGSWLGFVFGFVVLVTGNANVFLSINPAATIIVVILKGMLAGFASGAVYKLIAGKSRTLAAVIAAIICPIVNTAVFLIGSFAFFLPKLTEWGAKAGFENVITYILVGMVGMNFLFELGLNLVLSPTIVRLIQYGQDRRGSGNRVREPA